MIDLHSHTTASDGQHTPAELFDLAARAGVTTLAVTDHDTVAGLPACAEAARGRGLTLVPGIELSAFTGAREVHILGHFVDATNEELARFSERLRDERRERMERMVERVRQLGFPVTMDDVYAIAGDAQLGRPHLARVLVDKRFVGSMQAAFSRLLGDRGPAYVERFKLTAEDAIALIHRASGTATLAHPGVSKIDRHELVALKAAALDGIEAHHSDHPPSLRDKYLRIAQELDLVPTAGSDFHGEKVAPGRHLGSASMSRQDFDRLKARAGSS